MPLTLPVSTVAECLRTDCYILGDKKKNLGMRVTSVRLVHRCALHNTASSECLFACQQDFVTVQIHYMRAVRPKPLFVTLIVNTK
jgi:hypothetical protein